MSIREVIADVIPNLTNVIYAARRLSLPIPHFSFLPQKGFGRGKYQGYPEGAREIKLLLDVVAWNNAK